MDSVKRVPYGVSDFIDIIKRNQYYVDKTMYIPLLEDQPDSLFFIRPRRFGKSLLLSMLAAYYDCSMKDQFQELFGNLWIGSHPTPLQGRYQVLSLDFSKIGGEINVLRENFEAYCNTCLDIFMDKYHEAYPEKTVESFYNAQTFHEKIAILDRKARQLEIPLYLIIDEYDNFTNVVLNEHGEKVYWALTHASGFYRDVFKKFKGMFERILISGVSPVTLDDLTSGFNIGWHISTKSEFNHMLGFSTEDVEDMFNYYKKDGKLPANCDIQAMIAEMKPWYDNYCFSEDALRTQSKVFNCDMVLYYLRNYMTTGEAPKEMIDPNTKTDYNKMKKLLQLDKLDGDRKGVIYKIAETGQIVSKLETSFPARMLVNPQMFTSLLFYYGMLTIKGTRGDKMILGIPNNNVRRQYYEYLKEQYDEKAPLDTNKLTDYFYDMAYDGKWEEGLRYMAEAYAKVSSIRDGIEAERNLQGFFMAYLNLCNYYITAPELELNHGYCDFFLLPDHTHYDSQHSYILELKVLSKKDFDEVAKTADGKPRLNADGKPLTKAEAQWEEATEQIRRYAEAPRVEALRQGTTLHKIIIQFKGWELARIEEVK